MRHLLNTLYVMTPQSYLRIDNGNVVVTHEGETLSKVPLHLIEGMVLFGALGMSPALMGACIERGIGVSFLGMTGKFLARLDGEPRGNVLLRRTQFRVADDAEGSLRVARRFIAAKIRSQRAVLMRFCRDCPTGEVAEVREAAVGMEALVKAVPGTASRDELMGVEGKAADLYFAVFGRMLGERAELTFGGRTRRPPKDEVNALLSLFYTLLAHDVAVACTTVGLDPYVGFLHVDRPGRTSLALDLMEELRPYVVDRFVLSLANRRQLGAADFVREADGGIALKDGARKGVVGLWQRRKQEQITHPFLGEKVPVGLLPYVQAQLLARHLRGDLEDYPAFIWR